MEGNLASTKNFLVDDDRFDVINLLHQYFELVLDPLASYGHVGDEIRSNRIEHLDLGRIVRRFTIRSLKHISI